MRKYIVRFEVVESYEVEIEAESEDSAIDQAESTILESETPWETFGLGSSGFCFTDVEESE